MEKCILARPLVSALSIFFLLCITVVLVNSYTSIYHARALSHTRSRRLSTQQRLVQSKMEEFALKSTASSSSVGRAAVKGATSTGAGGGDLQPADNQQDQVLVLPPLRIDEPPKKAEHQCPLPVLHPEKFEPIMKWGVRKQFKPCGFKNGNFSRVERRFKGRHALFNKSSAIDSSADQHDDTVVVVVVDKQRCGDSHPHVFEFGELKDSDFQRMKSTYDAEARQNELRDRFSNPHNFGKSVPARDRAHHSSANEVEFYLSKPYAVVECGQDRALHITAPKHARDGSGTKKKTKKKNNTHNNNNNNGNGNDRGALQAGFHNVLHFMWDSTSIHAFRRGAKKTKRFLEELHNDPSSPSHVFAFKHMHSCSCCSPGNQIPVYSGVMNGEGDFFVQSEPRQNSKDWIWNVARDQLGYSTFWSLDNAPDKSARDYHAFPSVDSRVVAPICLAGVLLSHKERACLGGKSVDEQVLDGLQDWWQQHRDEKKFAAIQFISPHEETEKQLIEVDEVVSSWLRGEKRLLTDEELSKTMVLLWSDHGINFGRYAASHDGELEKMFPFAFLILPKRGPAAPSAQVLRNLQAATEKLVTPYDLYATVRSLMFTGGKDGKTAPPIEHDPLNPPLPRAEDSHIMASFQNHKIVPWDMTQTQQQQQQEQLGDRSCEDANIPIEFCTCIPWTNVPLSADSTSSPSPSILQQFLQKILSDILVPEHHRLVMTNYSERCYDISSSNVELLHVEVQVWPLEYKPKMKETAKRIWMKPGRDFAKLRYRLKSADSSSDETATGVFVGVVSIESGLLSVSSSTAAGSDGAVSLSAASQRVNVLSRVQMGAAVTDLIRLDRVDSMKRKCGIVQKVPEQLCVCKKGEKTV